MKPNDYTVYNVYNVYNNDDNKDDNNNIINSCLAVNIKYIIYYINCC